jgi:hypothetical protein
MRKEEIYRYSGRVPLKPKDSISLANLDRTDETPTKETLKEFYSMPDSMSGSDYSGSMYNESNHKVFLAEHGDVPGIYDVWGGYGSFGVAIRLDALANEDIKRDIETMEAYGILSDEDYYELQNEYINKDWEEYVRDDFLKQVRESDPCLNNLKLSKPKLGELFQECSSETGEYWEDEGPHQVFIRLEKIIPVARDMLLARKTPIKRLPLLLCHEWTSQTAKEIFLTRIGGKK